MIQYKDLHGAACFLAENAGEQLQHVASKKQGTVAKHKLEKHQGLEIHWLHLVTVAKKRTPVPSLAYRFAQATISPVNW